MLSTRSLCVFVGFILFLSGVEASPGLVDCKHFARVPTGQGVNSTPPADLQVKVIPFHRSVTLMCSTGRSLTEHPIVYIWYRNGEVLYKDQSPWYQQLVGGDRSVTYSCAIEGCEQLRAPEVSVDSVNSTCFTVTYLKGRMCSGQKGKFRSCTITYPREVHVGHSVNAAPGHASLTCNNSCGQTDHQWYKNKIKEKMTPKFPTTLSSPDVYSCAVRNHEELFSDEVCVDSTNCWKFNYNSRRTCVLKKTTLNMSCSYSHPHHIQPPITVKWSKKEINTKKEAEELKISHRVKDYNNNRNYSYMDINNLRLTDSGEYFCRAKADEWKRYHRYPGVTVIVTDLRVEFAPSAEVTEGQRVTLTCTTSCPLTDDTKYLWYLNDHLTGTNNKHLVLDPVSSQDAGKYTCRVDSLSSNHSELRVETKQWITVATGVLVTLVVILPIILTAVFCFTRRKVSSKQSHDHHYDTVEQLDVGHYYETITGLTAGQEDHLYSHVADHHHHQSADYTDVQLHPPQEQRQELVHYRVVRMKVAE